MTLLTVLQVAKRLHCSTAYVRKLIAGKVPGMPRLNGIRLHRWLIPKDVFEKWLTNVAERSPRPNKGLGWERNGHGSAGA
jgi:excisionase family DNA binding protein